MTDNINKAILFSNNISRIKRTMQLDFVWQIKSECLNCGSVRKSIDYLFLINISNSGMELVNSN